ncbi:MAG: hypothetical protein K2N77_11345 [Lachnospiraceae bacterium]|nr:hypothetical protein [Lachnospiraceae bacterium]
MNILRAFSKQFFGAKYERIAKNLIACIILFLAAHTAGIDIKIAPSVLFLTATVSSTVIMWQTLNSSGSTDRMTGMFMLPFQNRKMTFSLVLVYTGYTLITRTFLILALFFAVYEWNTLQIAVSLLCACNGCLMAAAWYTVMSQKKMLPFSACWCGMLLFSIFFVREIITFSLIVLTSIFLSCLRLLVADAYVFYRPLSSKFLIRHTKGTGSILLYLLRYLLTNKNYLINTAGLCVIAGAMPLMLGQFEELHVMPLGFAILCLNTPICILLSCDPDLEQAVRTLPGQAERFCTRYCLFIFSVNIAVNSVYLISWQMRYGSIGGIEIITALLIALQSAVLSVLLEWFCPIRSRKLASDLWNHPRKYIVPLIMLLIAGLIGMWPVGIWILLCIVIAEVFSLSLIARRI